MAGKKHLDVETIMRLLKKEDAKMLEEMEHRQTDISNRVASIINKKTEYFFELTTALADVEVRCDAVLMYVEDFRKGRTGARRFEGRLQQILNLLKHRQATDPAPSTLKKTGLYSIYEMKVNYAKVLFKVESLQSIAKKDDKKTTSASAQSKTSKLNQAGPSSLSPRLDTIILQLKHTLKLAKTVIGIVETDQKELTDLASKAKIEDQEAFKLISVNHAHMHNLVDVLQRTVYDRTVPDLTASQRARLLIVRPVEAPNQIIPLTSRGDMNQSIETIENRLDRINGFCNEFMKKNTSLIMTSLWKQAMREVEPYLNGEVIELD